MSGNEELYEKITKLQAHNSALTAERDGLKESVDRITQELQDIVSWSKTDDADLVRDIIEGIIAANVQATAAAPDSE